MATEEARHELHEAARREFGDGPAATLMELFAMDPERVATKDDLAELRRELRDENANHHREITEVRGELTELRSELRHENAKRHAEITELRSELRHENAKRHAEITELRSELRDDSANHHREITEVRGELTQMRGELTDLRGSILLDNARQTRQLTLTILIAVVAQFAATVSVVLAAV